MIAPGIIIPVIVRLLTLRSFHYDQFIPFCALALDKRSRLKETNSSLLYLNLFGVLRELAMEELVLRLKGEVVS